MRCREVLDCFASDGANFDHASSSV